MAESPGPSGGSGGTVQNEQFYAGLIRKYYGAAAASKYSELYTQYQGKFPPTPQASSAYQIFDIYFAELVAGTGVAGAGKAVAKATAGTGSIAANTAAGWTDALGLGALAHWIGELISSLTDIHMWISLGWLALGLVLLILGLAILIRKPIESAAALGAV